MAKPVVNTASKALEGATRLTSEGKLPGQGTKTIKIDMEKLRQIAKNGAKGVERDSDRIVRVGDRLVIHVHDTQKL